MSPRDIELGLKVLGGAVGFVTLILSLKRWWWDRRVSELLWEIDERYAIDVQRDRPRFPEVFERENPAQGQLGILVRATYRGRHSLTITGLSVEWNFNLWGQVRSTPRLLHDGESWEQLIFTQMIEMEQVTAVTIEAEGGRRFRRELNEDYRRQLRAHARAETP
jgi:hypothetical protein